ncbi:MAG: ATP-binding cassette domain-containing protein, partial [Ktedonobacterales bacterium]
MSTTNPTTPSPQDQSPSPALSADQQAGMTPTPPEASDAVLYIDQVSKWFGAVHAVTDITIWARSGEITAIVGDNGAGKSTLIKCVAGVQAPTSGRILFGGEPVHFSSPEDARRAGIETVYQTLALVNDLTIWQNLFLNRERVRR